MRKCPYCAEEIQDEAIKCKHCGEFLNKEREANKWYFKPATLVTAFICVGPFALPLFWFNPRFSKGTKIVVTIVILVLSYYLGIAVINSLRTISKYYKQAFELLNQRQ